MQPRTIDLSEVRGQIKAKRTLEIAAAGGHHIVLVGPGGCGKTLLADAFAGLLPYVPVELHDKAAVAGRSATRLGAGQAPCHRRVVKPSQTGSRSSLLNDLVLANNGLLVLDDAERFTPASLALVREAIDRGAVQPGRGPSRPAHFQLLATVRCCPCGYGYESFNACGKGPTCQTRHQWRALRWFIDVADVQVMTEGTFACDWAGVRSDEPSIRVIQRVAEARLRQARRGQENAKLSGRALTAAGALKSDAAELLDKAACAQAMSGRDLAATLRVARTLADLEGVDDLRRIHIAEALIYRFLRPRYEPNVG